MSASVLIVDDDDDALVMLRIAMQAEGMQAVTANSGEAALRTLEGATPDIILLDAVMPGLDGFDTCRRIKARERSAHVPVIFMTGLTETEHVVQGLAAGGVDYVTKPLVLDELIARVRVHLGNARTTRGALSAVDHAGGRLLASDAGGHIRWATPETQRLLDTLDDAGLAALTERLALLIAGRADPGALDTGSIKLDLVKLGMAGEGEHLFAVGRSFAGMEAELLQRAFSLTPREADVLLWTAHGKANKDISEILNISARTVNKHLEQVFVKLGVENRASAAAAATRVILTGDL